MRWGVRRYQNKDGTLTNAGKKRYDKEMAKLDQEARTLKNKQRVQAKLDKLDAKKKEVEALKGKVDNTDSTKPKTKTVKDLSDDELRSRVSRLELEKRFTDLSARDMSRGKKFVKTVGNDMIKPAAISVGKQLVTSAFTAIGNKTFNLEVKGNGEYKLYTNNKKKN